MNVTMTVSGILKEACGNVEDWTRYDHALLEAAISADAENAKLLMVLATVRGFIEGEMIANAIVVPVDEPACGTRPTLIQVIDAALGIRDEQNGPERRDAK